MNTLCLKKPWYFYLKERIKEINDGELIALVQYSVFNDCDTDIFKKILNVYGIDKTLNHFSVVEYINTNDEARKLKFIYALREEQRNHLLGQFAPA